MPIKSDFLLTRDGAKLHYLDVGPRQPNSRPPVILLHGFGMRAQMWLPNVLPLARQQRFILPTFRGFGASASSHLTRPDIAGQNADDLEDLVNALQLDGAKLGGFSLGAITALHYQRSYSLERFSAYLHIDQSPVVSNSDDWDWGLMGPNQSENFARGKALLEAFEGVDRTLPFKQLPARLRRDFRAWMGDFFATCSAFPPMLALAKATAPTGLPARLLLPSTGWPVGLDCIHSYTTLDYDFRPDLASVRIPMTLLVGAHSLPYPSAGQISIREQVPHAELRLFKRSGHTVMLDEPVKFQRELKRFINS